MASTDPLQFYPTPHGLGWDMWRAFVEPFPQRILEPSAGDGALIAAMPDRRFRTEQVDVIEIDPMRQATLRGRFPSVRIIGYDFLKFTRGSVYSGMILNPPFQAGAAHVLHAWDIAWNAQIVALLNVETINNPCTQERLRLVKLIEQHGRIVKHVPNAFEDAERKAAVDCVIIHLHKQPEDKGADILGNVIGDLKKEREGGRSAPEAPVDLNALALPENELENAVIAFEAAVKTTTDAIVAEVRAGHYVSILGRSLMETIEGKSAPSRPIDDVQKAFAERYEDLKDRAWNRILNTSKIRSRLSLQAQKRLESEFDQIKQLDFTLENVYGFLGGLLANMWELQLETLEYTFDSFTRYASGNLSYFRGWKSNDRHKGLGWRLRDKRVILKARAADSWSRSLWYEDERVLAELDKAFALLDDGKEAPEYGLVQAAGDHFKDLLRGQRIDSTYFQMRYYKGIGTIHLFPKRKDLVDRLNRVIGAHRQWIPPETSASEVGPDFWKQYEQADKFHDKLVDQLESKCRWAYDSPLRTLHHARETVHTENQAAHDQAAQKVLDAFRGIHEAAGLDVDRALAGPTQASTSTAAPTQARMTPAPAPSLAKPSAALPVTRPALPAPSVPTTTDSPSTPKVASETSTATPAARKRPMPSNPPSLFDDLNDIEEVA
ncbi:hypothetical protein BJI67_16340 (plasmid) [Acidihalobacter aeolianus]|uniref:DUF4942 domain-containing protein n=1 Tax=Acidihalobacter aeolianus TaxID=2792603 RepID=A0A1D8KCW8_9GAMM|nr:DUF4942 domain-containing protein [Acidihalobacter aeolianus]AOV18807.1 hypothetical protein BJI67_16340 [Acidihalobacter aeolianus]